MPGFHPSIRKQFQKKRMSTHHRERLIIIRSFSQDPANGLPKLLERCLPDSTIKVVAGSREAGGSAIDPVAGFVSEIQSDLEHYGTIWRIDESVAGDWISFVALMGEAEELGVNLAFVRRPEENASCWADSPVIFIKRPIGADLQSSAGAIQPMIENCTRAELGASEPVRRHFVPDGLAPHLPGVRLNLTDETARREVLGLYDDLGRASGHCYSRYHGEKRRRWFADDRERWLHWFSTANPVKFLEVNDRDGISANLLLEQVFPHSGSSAHVVSGSPFIEEEEHALNFDKNFRLSGRQDQLSLYNGDAREALAWMIAADGYWESFDFILLNCPEDPAEVLIHACQAWILLKPRGTMIVDCTAKDLDGVHQGRAAVLDFLRHFAPSTTLLHEGDRLVIRKADAHPGAATQPTKRLERQ